MKRAALFAYFLVVSFTGTAQSHEFRFFPVKDLSWVYQGVVGKVGNHFFLINRLTQGGLDLFIYDTVSQTGNKRFYTFPRQISSILVFERSIVFAGVTANAEQGVSYHFIELDENGNEVRRLQDSLRMSPQMNVLASPDKKNVLYFQYFKRGPDSAFIQAAIIGNDGLVKKNLAYTFKHDKERDDEPETFLDNNGNTHIVVYDKYNNYRLSTDLTINTIPFAEELMTSETFSLQKTKLKTMQIFQNKSCNCLQAQGMYADGSLKTVRGMYTISFPIARRNEIRQRYSAFTPGMIKDFKKGFAASDGGIANALYLQEMISTDSGTYAIFKLNSELVQMQEKRIRANRPWVDFAPQAMVTSRANNWNSPKMIYLKIGRDQNIAWHSIKGQDVFRFTEARYNRVYVSGDESELLTTMSLADKADEPQPVLLTIRNGEQLIEKLPEKFLTLSPLQLLSKQLYGSVYVNDRTKEGGLLLVVSK
ncbi:hypothetical protein GWC95_02125 [Sediminibacterium roseum]|uniref:WD40-like Beta Propeller Repeat n=1 Tax=Sediminibacterium roseum TaxID=1978412 RepID=A0ABW9ZNN8_9BACT|nr:hypothetical protein [Sediminibacterium roseum]NCI48704.1 hypothetical protein [Sediminibacterium roseum]